MPIPHAARCGETAAVHRWLATARAAPPHRASSARQRPGAAIQDVAWNALVRPPETKPCRLPGSRRREALRMAAGRSYQQPGDTAKSKRHRGEHPPAQRLLAKYENLERDRRNG